MAVSADTASPPQEFTSAMPAPLRQALRGYRARAARPAAAQLATTLIPLTSLFWLMHRSLTLPYWVTLSLAVPTAGFVVRAFIIMHDCAHGSFTRSRRVNEVIGIFTGAIALTPFAHWRREHALHHAGSGDLTRRGHGDITTLTIEEYLARDRWGRLKYRLYRNPLVLLGVGPFFLLFNRVQQLVQSATGYKQPTGAQPLDMAMLGIVALTVLVVGPKTLALVYIPAFVIGAFAGIWLSHIQHQFEDAYWEDHGDWDFTSAALRGSSYYRLPRALEWITGSIGLHHVHHLDPKIPNYNLRQCHEENGIFQGVPELTLRGSLRTLRLRLWDPQQGRLVGFDAIADRLRAEQQRAAS
ncbi:MAG: fatty acid desaturase [Gemmatimonadaceae bacterium]